MLRTIVAPIRRIVMDPWIQGDSARAFCSGRGYWIRASLPGRPGYPSHKRIFALVGKTRKPITSQTMKPRFLIWKRGFLIANK